MKRNNDSIATKQIGITSSYSVFVSNEDAKQSTNSECIREKMVNPRTDDEVCLNITQIDQCSNSISFSIDYVRKTMVSG